ncbi:MAG: hypothetical protein IT159_05135 [Bryobacterales bacterium]|nr:hypothetical protein [Bryobacterales bacterium]
MTLARVALGLLALQAIALGHVTRVVVESRAPLAASGRHVKITGRFYGELDPKAPQNAIINDIQLAPRNAHGRVEYSATFTLILPSAPAAISGVLLYEVPNRGNSPLNARLSADDLAAGHVLLSSGWQGDLAERTGMETIRVPVARNPDGSSITGPVLARLMNLPAGANTAPLTTGYGALLYQHPASMDTGSALLTRQASEDGQLIPIPNADWAFADCSQVPFPGRPDPSSICLKGGFQPDQLYRVVYTAKDPLVLGIGLAATRDIVSFFRYEQRDGAGESSPLAGRIRHAIGSGTSQSGNFIRTFIHLGFNQDEEGRIVWDGVNPNIAGRQLAINFRFAIPGGAAEPFQLGSEAVLWWGTYRDTVRGRPASSLLDRCRATKTCPKVMETFGSAEFWGLRMSPGLVGTGADADIPLPPEVRRYYFPGVTHGGGRGGFDLNLKPPAGCALAANPNSTAESMRALRRALIDWVVKDAPPPESRYPLLQREELAAPDRRSMGFPAIPGAPLPDNMLNRLPDHDVGPDFRYNDVSGVVSRQPPAILRTIPMLVPKTDPDGNEQAGVPLILNQAPLGTYLGWNVTASGYLKGQTCGFAGGFIPFARTRAERLAEGDPRPSLEERYGTHEGYVSRVRAAAERLVRERFLLPEDAGRIIEQAEASAILR